jgi:hypothetical protein
MLRKIAFIFCFVALTLWVHWVYGQEASTPSLSSSAVLPVELKPVKPAQDKWEFEVIPYGIMPTLKGNVTIKGIDGKVNMSFGDIWSDLTFAGMMHIEAKKDRWGLFLDATYMNLKTSVEGTRSFSGPLGLRTADLLVDADIGMEQWAVEFGGSYQLGKTPVGQDKTSMMYLDLLAGGRYWYLSTDVDVGLILDANGNQVARNISQSGSKQWIDPFIGLRTRFQLTKDLMMVFRGDVGGFSVGSKFSWNVAGYIGYSVSEMVGLWAGYRALGVDYRDGSGYDKFVYDVVIQGPVIGVGFRF